MANDTAKATIYLDGKQAEAAIDALKAKAEALKKELKKAQDAGDNIKLNKISKELAGVESSLTGVHKESFDVQKVLQNLNGSSLNDLKKALGTTQREWNRMAKTDAGYKEKTDQLNKLKAAVKDSNSVLQQQTGFMGNLQNKLSMMPGALGSMATGIISVGKATVAFFLTPVGAIIGIIAAVVLGAKALITNSIEFGKAASSLSAITGAVGKDLDFLKKKAREIAKDSTQSATDMLKAFQTIGGAMPELLKNGPLLAEVTKNAVMLSESTGGQLAVTDAAKAAAAALNQFNIPLTESARAVNVLAAGSLAGSAEVDNITEALKNLGPVASGANMNLEDTVAAIELVAEKGILGAEAGTKLRGVILKLQAESLGYASGQFNLKDAIDEANKTIDAQSTAMEKDAYMAKLFGIENVTAGRIVLENVDKYVSLTKAVTGTNTAYDQARIQMDNLDGSNKKFSGAWKNMMLSIEDGNGMLSRGWKAIVDGATWLLNGLTSQFENLGASIRAIGIVFTNFYDQMKTPLVSLGRLLKAVFTMDFADMAPAMAAFKSSLADIGKDGSLNLGKIALEQLKIGQASKEATALLKQQKKELEGLQNVGGGKKYAASTDAPDKPKSDLEPRDNQSYDMLQPIAATQVTAEDIEFATKKHNEEEWTKFLQKQVDKQMKIKADGLNMDKQIEQAREELRDVQIDSIGQLAGALSGMFESGSTAAIAFFAIEKAVAIAQIWLNYAKESAAIAVAAAEMNAISFGTAGTVWGAVMQTKALTRAGINTGIVAAQAIVQASQFYEGGPTGGDDKRKVVGVVHGKEYVIPEEGYEAPGIRPFIDLIEIARRNGSLARLDLRPVVQSISSGKMYSSGGSTSSWSMSSTPTTGTNDRLANSIDKFTELLNTWDPAISIEKYEREKKTYDKITNGGLK